MNLETIANVGIPVLVALLSYLCVCWSRIDQPEREPLLRDEPLINQP